MTYKWDGFRQPITDTAHDLGAMSTFKAGSTIPVRYEAAGESTNAATRPNAAGSP